MESSTQKSPVWRKPSDIMKLRQLKNKKRNLQRRFGEVDEEDTKVNHLSRCRGQGNGDCRNNNPFRCSPRKRQRKDEPKSRVPSPVDEFSCDSTLFQLLQVTSNASDSQLTNKQSESLQSEFSKERSSQEELNVNDSCTSTSGDATKWEPKLPYDWSLKTALRLTSTRPFPWNSGRISTPEEASGVTGHVRCLDLNSRGKSERFALDTSPNAQLFQCCQVWIHPSLPWLKLFPRHQSRTVSTSTSSVPIPIQIHKSLQSDWAESFRSLFHLLRARQCPYFYVCAHGFTILFRAPGMGSNPRIHALLTPTTRGLRAALSEEGVQFKLPLCDNLGSKDDDVDDELHLDESESATEKGELPRDDVVSWLKSVGVEENMLSQNDSNSDMQKEIDYRHQSLVYVEDGDVHALFNFLLNSKSCIVSTGPLAGIPPTLLAPVAFTGSTLRSLKMRQQVAQRDSEQVHVFDLIGPILPHTAHYLDRLLQSKVQDSHFEILFSTLEPTLPFSLYSPIDTEEAPASIFGQQSLSDCGLTFEVIEGMCSQRKSVVLREVKSFENKYYWKS